MNKKDLQEIKPGIGLGVLKFGMDRNEVSQILGKPTEIDAYSYTDDGSEKTESWEYEELGLSLNFDEEEGWRLVIISVIGKEHTLNSEKLIGQNKEKIIAALEKMGCTDIKTEMVADEEGEKHELITTEKLSLEFWFSNNELEEIQWSPVFIDDDTIKWPK